jgi:prolyl 4-hydroxylase
VIPALGQSYPGGRQIAGDPQVFLFEAFLTLAECAHLIELSEPSMTRAFVSGGADGVESEGRTCSVNWVQHDRTSTTLAIAERTAHLVGFPLDNAEALQVINYGPGQEYKPHCEHAPLLNAIHALS